MSDNSNSHPELRGYNSDVRSYSTPQVSSSLTALAGSGSSVPLQATPLPPEPLHLAVVPLNLRRDEGFLRSLPLQSRTGDLGEGPPLGVPSGFTSHPMSKGSLSISAKHKARDCPLHLLGEQTPHAFALYSDHRVLKAAGLSLGSYVDLGAPEALKAIFNVHDHVPPPSPAAPATSSDQMPFRPPAPIATEPVVLSSSSKEDEVAARFKARHPIGELPSLGPRGATPDPQGIEVNTSQGSMGNLSASPHPPPGQGQELLLPTDHALAATPARASGHSTTIFLEPEDQREVVGDSSGSLLSLSPCSGVTSCKSISISIGRTPNLQEKDGIPLANPRCWERPVFRSLPPFMPRALWSR
ncbi:hypothetical protein LIER_25487 [Lithospermum erythrorhizon]|uniref:Uncharacterized protein n=1 Tax=Lithospermum erythrorhizon TaxID=34254 RepID=A0AAV3RAR9_LITER